MFERPFGDVTSVEKMASQESASNVRLGECPFTAGKRRDACQEGRFRRACRVVGWGLSYLQVRLKLSWLIYPCSIGTEGERGGRMCHSRRFFGSPRLRCLSIKDAVNLSTLQV